MDCIFSFPNCQAANRSNLLDHSLSCDRQVRSSDHTVRSSDCHFVSQSSEIIAISRAIILVDSELAAVRSLDLYVYRNNGCLFYLCHLPTYQLFTLRRAFLSSAMLRNCVSRHGFWQIEQIRIAFSKKSRSCI